MNQVDILKKERRQNQLSDILEGYRERALAAEFNNNEVGAKILAMLCGMYAHTFGVKQSINLFLKDSPMLHREYSYGYKCSFDAVQMNDVLREKFKKKEDAQDEELNKKKRSFLGISY